MKEMDYLIVIDYYSRYVEAAATTKTTKSSEVITAFKSIFARHGIPEQLRSDNGSQHDCAVSVHRIYFKHFLTIGFSHVIYCVAVL